ncbi:MAG: dienelactone hydrolase family protein [Burkholderiales bacterium]
MGKSIELKSADGRTIPAYVAEPSGQPKGAIVVLQEIFGLNSHIRSVADGFANDGYLAVAPAMFERVEPGIELDYAPADIQAGSKLKTAVEALPAPGALADVQAAIDHASSAGKVGVVGYCWGGLMTWRAACLLDGLAAAVPYYGGGMTVGAELQRTPKVPVLAHFGEQDTHISLESVEAFKKAQPKVELHLYPAHHGFNCDQRGSYNEAAAKKARERTLAFFEKHLA